MSCFAGWALHPAGLVTKSSKSVSPNTVQMTPLRIGVVRSGDKRSIASPTR
jgi:hypothetical protein